MPHDFKRFPELTNNQMDFYYWESPHRQIMETFNGKIVRVIDGDTVRVGTNFRDFETVVRFFDNEAPELDERGGLESKEWLESQILGKEVTIEIEPNLRVEKWGRILGKIIFGGIDIGEQSIIAGKSVSWGNRNDGRLNAAI